MYVQRNISCGEEEEKGEKKRHIKGKGAENKRCIREARAVAAGRRKQVGEVWGDGIIQRMYTEREETVHIYIL